MRYNISPTKGDVSHSFPVHCRMLLQSVPCASMSTSCTRRACTSFGGRAVRPRGAPQREHSIAVAAHHRQARHRHGLGRVPLRQDEGAVLRVPGAGVVGVVQFGNACARAGPLAGCSRWPCESRGIGQAVPGLCRALTATTRAREVCLFCSVSQSFSEFSQWC